MPPIYHAQEYAIIKITLDEISLVHKLAVIKPRTGKGSPPK
jgi:hypothetical protein